MLEFLRFLIFALVFVGLLTLAVRLARLRVNGDLPYAEALGVTTLFIASVVGVWWFVTRGGPEERIVQALIMPSPMEVLKAFGPLHFQQGLFRSAFYSRLRGSAGFG